MKKISSKVALVVSNNSSAGALEIARKNGIPAVHLSHRMFPSEKEFVNAFLRLMNQHSIGMIILAGYMKFLSPEIVKKFRNRILNIHPALLPSFGGTGLYGIKVHEAVIGYGAKVTGATVHIVDEFYDHGPVVIQKTVPVSDDDTPETLQKRVLKLEHRLLPEAIRLFETGNFKLSGRRVMFDR